jgi:glycerophosphoryl diester phosphodiesterase
MGKRLVCLIVLVWLSWGAASPGPQGGSGSLHSFNLGSAKDLKELLSYSKERVPLVSAHRGGARNGFPENCIATFENTLRYTHALLEVDPRYTRDGAIVLMHDATLERTTTGRGNVADYTLAQLKELRLKDPEGNVTDYRIPTLDEALEWAKGKTVLVLDQKTVQIEARVRKIREHQAQAHALVIAYSLEDAKRSYELDKEIMQEVMMPDRAAMERFARTGVPWQNVVAFVTHTSPAEKTIFQLLHEQGVLCIVGTSRTLDRDFTAGKITDRRFLTEKYQALIHEGVDILEADLGIEAGQALQQISPQNRLQRKYMSVPSNGGR